MAHFKALLAFVFISSVCLSSLGSLFAEVNDDDDVKVYIVYMGSIPRDSSVSLDQHHLNILEQVLEGRAAKESLIRSYTKSFNGFAARLTEKESETLRKKEGVVSVFPSKKLQLMTSRSWDFIGFPIAAQSDVSADSSSTIIGVLDSGIWPESPSFNDEGFNPPPSKWKGACKGGQNFTCNNKIIGARTYIEHETARDNQGHGSHTASTAAGRRVKNVSFYGFANGTARGGAPSARIAVYKVCSDGCEDSGILAAFDDAIEDGVDLITLSLGYNAPFSFDTDSIAIGAFHALEKGILTVQSAGNQGNIVGSITSVAPWLFSVAASCMDRHIVDKATLGNGKVLTGNSINSFTMKGDKFPLVYGKEVTSICDEESARSCEDSCLDSSLVKGKIVVCDGMGGIFEAARAGALGAIAETRIEDASFVFPLPAIALGSQEYGELHLYLNSTKHPVGKILRSEVINDTTAPHVVSFSSRGPNRIAPDILKPDVTAPGVEILAAFSPIGFVSGFSGDKRSVHYSILSGTSMACPHVAGAAAHLKSHHPDWSPAMIKSALMTTAHAMSPFKNHDAEFAYGSGHLNPSGAMNPGLVYDSTKDDHIKFLCKLGYDKGRIRLITGDSSSSCSKKKGEEMLAKDVNYPSMSAMVEAGKPFTVRFQRTVTNVGTANSTYRAKIIRPRSKIKVKVEPSFLSFMSLKEKKSFNVTVVGMGLLSGVTVSASLSWSDGIHTVRSPIVMYSK